MNHRPTAGRVRVAAVVILSAWPALAAADDREDELAKLAGNWKVVRLEVGGMAIEPPPGAPQQLRVEKAMATFYADGRPIETFKDLRLVLDPKQKPKHVDLLRGEKETLPAIYEIDGDRFRLAMPLIPEERRPGSKLPRPKSFDSKTEAVVVLTAERVAK